MKDQIFARVLMLSTAALLVSCTDASNKIGSTIKGDRISVLEQVKTVEADKDIDVKPSLPSQIINLSWPQAGYDSQHVLPNVEASAHPAIVWTSSVGEGSSSNFKLLARPVASRGIIYTMDSEGLVRAFDAKTGDNVWERSTAPKDGDGSAMGGGLAVDGPLVFATTGFGDVYALDTKTGTVKWTKALLKPLRAAPTVHDNRVYVVSIDNELNALSAETGDILWHQSGIAESAALLGASSPAVQGDSVFVAYNSGEIYGLRVQNGRVLWNYSLAAASQVGALPAIADIRGLPVVDQGRVFAISHSGRIASIDQRTGDRLWEVDIGGINTPVVAGDAVFVYSTEGNLVALSRENGRALWVQPLQKREDPDDKASDPIVWTGPVLATDRLWMVNSLGQMQSFSAESGEAFDLVDLDGPAYLAPIIVDRTYYVVTDSGTLVALR